MKRVWNVLNWLQGSLWLIPAIMSLAAVCLAYVLVGPAEELFEDFAHTWWLYSGDGGTARDLLSTLLSGMITMTSLVVSITVVVLSLAANQLGPRLIWNFIADRRIQTVIGLFVGTILYTLLVLRTIGDDPARDAVPHIAVTVASLLTIACLFALLFHVNLIAHSIVSDTIVREVAGSLDTAVARLPRDPPRPADGAVTASYPHRRSASLRKSGYVQAIDYESLCKFACEHDLLIVMNIRAGHFVLSETRHFEVRAHEPISDDIVAGIAETVIAGSGRTATQDLEYSVRQLVEIALRALSPSLNDPHTAIAVIDRLAAALEIVSGRSLPAKEYRDNDGRLRVIVDTTDYEGLVEAAFNQIRQAANANVSVLIGLGHRLADLLQIAASAEQRQAIVKQLKMVERAAGSIAEPEDRDDLLSVIAAAMAGDEG
ncbi:MAG TPA: DUF2254 domain-containing protein [Aestuariivirgaceae bacterium]|nr:DUF2254 domain-containing protein [Aestuariivirgaceae bacterium]